MTRANGLRRTGLILLTAFALVLAACGDGDSDTTEASETEETSETSETTEASDTDDADDGATDEADADDGAADEGAATGCDPLPTKVDGTLTVATGEPVFPPWMIDDEPSNGEGFESAVVYAVAEELGLAEVEWVRTTFEEAIAPGPKDYDFNIQQYSITPERDEVVDFAEGYYQVEQAIIGPADGPAAAAASLADLAELRLGAASGTTSLGYIENVIEPSTDASVYDDNASAKAAFDAGQIDALVFDLPTAYFITAVEIPDASIIGVLPRVGEPEELGMLFEDASPLVECVNEALAALRDNGTIEELETAWLNDGGNIPTLAEG